MQQLTRQEARVRLIHYQGLMGKQESGLEATRQVMQHLHTIQFDPLDVVGRNPDLCMQSRVRNYRKWMLEKLLYTEHFLVDGYDKEMCIFLSEDFGRFEEIRQERAEGVKQWLAGRGQGEAFELLEDMRELLRREGPSLLRDIRIGESRDYGWGPRRTSGAAIEYLFQTGEVCIADREGAQKRFDLTDRVLPEHCLQGALSGDALDDWYVQRRIGCVGLLWDKAGSGWLGTRLSKSTIRKPAIRRLCEQGKLIPCKIEGQKETFYAVEELISGDVPSLSKHVRFLAPLDNILWERDMVEALFGFQYRWEVYTPVEKRQYGYYVLPVLYGDQFVGRMEPENYREGGVFRIHKWWWEDGIRWSTRLLEETERALKRFAAYLGSPWDATNMDLVRQATR